MNRLLLNWMLNTLHTISMLFLEKDLTCFSLYSKNCLHIPVTKSFTCFMDDWKLNTVHSPLFEHLEKKENSFYINPTIEHFEDFLTLSFNILTDNPTHNLFEIPATWLSSFITIPAPFVANIQANPFLRIQPRKPQLFNEFFLARWNIFLYFHHTFSSFRSRIFLLVNKEKYSEFSCSRRIRRSIKEISQVQNAKYSQP